MNNLLIIATILGGIAAIGYFWDKAGAWLGVIGKPNQHDIELYEKYKKLIVDSGVAEFYRSHDFLGAFDNAYWTPFSYYLDTWGTVNHEFVNSQLNRRHKKVYEKALELGSAIAKNTVSIGTHGNMRSVKPDYLPIGPTPEHIKTEAKEINSLVPEFINAHQKFVRLANRKLRRVVA